MFTPPLKSFSGPLLLEPLLFLIPEASELLVLPHKVAVQHTDWDHAHHGHHDGVEPVRRRLGVVPAEDALRA